MKSRLSSPILVVAAVLGLYALGRADYDLHWWPYKLLQESHDDDDISLSENNGGRALAFGPYSTGWQAIIAYECDDRAIVKRIADDEPLDHEIPNSSRPCEDGNAVTAVSFGASTPQKHAFWLSLNGEDDPVVAYADTHLVISPIDHWADISDFDASGMLSDVAMAVQHDDNEYVCLCYGNGFDEAQGIYRAFNSSNGGGSWSVTKIIDGGADGLSLAASDDQDNMFLGVHQFEGNEHHVKVFKSTDHGSGWSQNPVLDYVNSQEPCVATYGSAVAAVWVYSSKIRCSWSIQNGDINTWTTEYVPFRANPNYRYAAPSVSIRYCQDPTPAYLVTIAAEFTDKSSERMRVATMWGRVATDGGMTWCPWGDTRISRLLPLGPEVDDFANPCIATCIDGVGKARTLCVWTDDGAFGGGDGWCDLYGNYADWKYKCPNQPVSPPVSSCGIGGGGLQVINGTAYYTARVGANIQCGEAREDGFLEPDLLSCGTLSALAADAGGSIWACFLRDDSVWCETGNGSYEMVYAGSSSAVPGQPSIVCYPTQGGGASVANVVFPVYDTTGGASRIMYARVSADQVTLDTIESVANLRDSLPSISVFKSDTLICVLQHGDSVISKLLADYGPSTQGQPPAWSNANLVTASGFHPMSVMENGNVLNCCYTQQNGGYSIQHATCDLSGGGMFPSWVAMTPPSATSNVDKGNPVYAGVGASVWQQQAGGKWVIKGYVRGAETTLVANDTDAYHPHAVAESSAVSPSIDRIKLSLLYDAGVAFEVDSGVSDTGEVRFSQFNFDVSNAGPDATRANNGCKLTRNEACDSLHAVYQDADGTVMYAYSAAGDSWRREVLATSRSYPAIASDSTGKRWVVAMTAFGTLPAAQYLYYQSGGSWASQSLYSGWDILGPASLAGASSTTTGIAYTAFKVMGMFSQYIVLTKFNGTTVAACTVATGASFGDPSIAVEAYKTDSDHVHVTWEDAGVVKYRMDTDGRSSGIANNWTAVVTLSDAQATSHHPSINCDRDQIVAAWAQGATAEIYYRKRSTASAYNNWDAALNLSNTANNASDWPTIAMGDTVVVAWQEARTGGTDFDILACVNFGDTLNVADNATVSGYPHVLFQNKASGDTAIPYLHCVWSETPSANFYEVAYNKLNLKQSSGEGQQSAKQVTLPVKPLLASCMPNPFRNHTQINYALPAAGNVSLRVYDVTGRTVRTLASGHQTAGNYSVNWDARDSRGKQVPYGVYFYRLDTPGFRSVKKAVVAR